MKNDYLEKSQHKGKQKMVNTLLLPFMLLFFCQFSVFAQANTGITLSIKNATIKQFLTAIEKQSSYKFMYREVDIPPTADISIVIKGKPIGEVLSQVLSPRHLSYSINGNKISIIKSSPQSEQKGVRRITGNVVDDKGEPVIGANVLVKGKTTGTITDIDGNFNLDAAQGQTLIISYIGYTPKEIAIGTPTSYNISIAEDMQNLDEVVVVGYGTQKKVNLTGSVAMVGGEKLTQSPTRSVSNALSGLMPGVFASNRSGAPGSDVSSILIRGKSTLGSTSPLIVIDGVWGREGMNQIDPNDIENISVLKDASAAIYGAQAANGVILITTKRGKENKPTLSYTFNMGMRQPTRLPKLANSSQYAGVYNDLLNIQGQPNKFQPEEILAFENGSDPFNYPNTNWIKETLKTFNMQQQHSLSLRGGSDRVKYYVSTNFSDENSMFKNGVNYYSNLGIRSNVDAKVNDYIKVALDLSTQQYETTSPAVGNGTIMNSMWRNYPYLHARYPNGLPGAGIERGENPIVMSTRAAGYNRQKVSLYQATFNFDIVIPWVKGLGIDGFAAYDRKNTYNKNWFTPWTVYNYVKSTDTYEKKIGGNRTKPELKEESLYSNRITLNAKLKYDANFDIHNINAFLAVEQTLNQSNDFSAFRKNYMSSAIDQIFAGDENNQVTTGGASEMARRNLFGRVSYGLKDRYLADFNFRYDGSSVFPAHKRWGFFPGVSLAWRISEEPFMKNRALNIDNLKLRASWGQMGNDQVAAFQYLANYSFTNGYFLGDPGVAYKGIARGLNPNPNITWEVANTYNVAIDAGFWNGLLGVTADLFLTRRNNILTARNASIPLYTGLKLPNENIGTVENKGIELQLTHSKRVSKKLTYSLLGNVSYVKNNIINIDEASNAQTWQMRTGHPMGTDLYYLDMGIYRTQEEIDKSPHPIGTRIGDLRYVDYNDDKEINSKDRVRLDKTNVPEIVFGLNGSISYGGFDLNILFQGQANAWQYIYLQSGLGGNTLEDLAVNRFTKENPNSKYPHLTTYETEISGYRSTFWLKNSAFLRLKNVEIGYSIPAAILKRAKIERLRVYVSGFNLLTIDGLKWFDPEGGDERGNFYPQNRIFNFGLNLIF